MATHPSSGGNLFVSLLLFLAAAGLALLLLLASAVAWVAQLLDSFIWSALIFGGLFAVAAVLIYLLLVRSSLAHVREQAATIYEVAHLVERACEWVEDKVRWFRAIWNLGSDE